MSFKNASMGRMPSQDKGAPHLPLDSHVASSQLRLIFELLENSLDKSGQT